MKVSAAKPIEAIYFAANIESNTHPQVVDEAATRLRTLAAKLLALHATSPWLDFVTGYELKAAAVALVGVSNTLAELEMKLHHHMVLKSFGLPLRLSDADLNEIAAALRR